MHPTANKAELPASLVLAARDILREPGTSLHRQIFLVLRDNILRGAWAPGSALPTEEALGEQFCVSRVTVRRALSDLAAQDLVKRRHGLGTFVPENFAAARPDPTLDAVAGLRQSARESEVRVIEVQQRATPSVDVIKLLHLAPQEQASHVVRLRHIGDAAVMLTDAWAPVQIGGKITAAALKKHALYELLLAQGVKFGRVVQEISAEAANAQKARLLGTELAAPLIRMKRLIHDTEGRPVMFLTGWMPPENTRILMDIPGEAMNTLEGGRISFDLVPGNTDSGSRKRLSKLKSRVW